ncbi:MAG: ATP-binding protein [Caldilinea sp. CFX5]|nr:ATP-binding protein [Caldilinea sp. CFX5]
MQKLTNQALEFVHRWLRLYETQRRDADDFQHHIAEELQQALSSKQQKVLDELTQMQTLPLPSYLLSSLHCCRRAVGEVYALFDQDALVSPSDMSVNPLLNGELLAEPRLELDDQWRPRIAGDELIQMLLQLISRRKIDWVTVFQKRCERCDHQSTAYLLEYFETQVNSDLDLSALQNMRKRAVEECRNRLARVIEKTRKEVDRAVAYGLLREVERNNYISIIQSIEIRLPEQHDFWEQYQRLQQIYQEVETLRTQQVSAVRKRMVATGITVEHEAYLRIQAILDKGDPLTANEYIDMALQGITLPEAQMNEDRFAAFFPQTLRQIERYLDANFEVNRITRELRNYAVGNQRNYRLGPIDMYQVAGPQATVVAEVLELWFAAKRMQRIQEAQLRIIVEGLGFPVTSVTIRPGSRRLRTTFTTGVIKDKNLCPVAHFGSSARGEYQLICAWDRPTVEELLHEVGETIHTSTPVLVFYFNRLTESRRRELARFCHNRRRMFIVVDDVLLLYLCGVRAPRLRTLFECSLPFTFLEPYAITAGVVPPELFYGRQRERDAIVDPMGSCFIYGGRQLGKTALLREVERNFHNPDLGHVVIWLDLKAEGIGYDRPIEEIWNLILRELKKHTVISTKVPHHTSIERILEYVQEWLEEDNRRRILLLLDEADRFLESDGKQVKGAEFQHAARIKGLMDRTNRRFKVVFAGLHNVQRTTRQENHPLAHYGEPICIGPLLDNDEWREARKLIEQPLASIGYRFDSPDLITLILSQTNYYPNLIQIYCTQLLRHISNTKRVQFDLKTSPPYVITSRHVNEVFQSQELRELIRQRFNWTLQLDQRYEVIAYAVAHISLEEDSNDIVEGFPVARIRQEALYWWPEGFSENTPEDAFRALVDEMVGLGILRVVNGYRYALRSPNVVLLMGTRDDIERELLRKREPAIEYEPATFRSVFRGSDTVQITDPMRRSPLTAQQESELRSRKNGVSLIVGCDAAGLKELDDFLEFAFGQEFVLSARPANLQEFVHYLAVLDQREKDGTTLLLVPSGCSWDIKWMGEALRKSQRLLSKRTFVRIVFVADPMKSWQLIHEQAEEYAKVKTEGVTVFTLQPWHETALRQWFEECGFGPRDKEGRREVYQITGNWPLLLGRFQQAALQRDPHLWRQALAQTVQEMNDPVTATSLLKTFGIRRTMQQEVLTTLGQLDVASVSDLSILLQKLSSGTLNSVLEWADLLGFVKAAGNNQWRLDPVIERLLLQSDGAKSE